MKMQLYRLVLTSLLIWTNCLPTLAQTIEIQGEQTGVLNADTVMLVGMVTVPANETLTFLPGTRIIATGFYGFGVYGNISAQGIEETPIVFSVSDTSGFYNPENGRGGWNGFSFTITDPLSDSSLFSYCRFEFGKAYGDSLEKMGGVFNIRNFNKIRISDCEFTNNRAYYWGGAVFAESSNILIRDCDFTGNFCGTPGPPYGYGGAVCIRYSVVDLLGCSFSSNSSTGIGGAVSFEYSDILLQSNVFHENSSGLGGALGYLRSTPVRQVSNNLFTGNTSVFFGGAISCNRANPHFVNNTITANSSVSYGGGFYCNDSAVPVLVNNIIFGNFAPSGEQVYIWDVYSAPEFYYCNVQGGPAAFGGTGGSGFDSPYLNNIDTLPGFSGFQPYPWSLVENSPCINAGNPDTSSLMLPDHDLAGNPRIVDNRIDIGTFENPTGMNGIINPESELVFSCYPNPFRNQITFDFSDNLNDPVNIRITDISGKEILHISGLESDHYVWRSSNPGVYFVVVNAGNSRAMTRLICTN